MHLLAQDLVNGILAGGILAVVALGFSLVWGIMNIINLAHGAFIMLGAYVTWQLFTSFHLDPFLSLPISFVLLFALGYLIQRYLINWVARAPVLTTFLLTFGLSLLIVNVALLVWTGDTRGVTTAYSGTNFTLGGVTVPWAKLYTLIAALAITGVMQLWLTRSRTGRAIRATVDGHRRGAARRRAGRADLRDRVRPGRGPGGRGRHADLALVLAQPGDGPAVPDQGLRRLRAGRPRLGAGRAGRRPGLRDRRGVRLAARLHDRQQHISGTGLQDAVALVVLLIVLIVRPTGIMGRATA